MAKILCNYYGLSMAAEGKSEFVGRQAAAFLGYVQQDAERCAASCDGVEDLSAAPEEIKREILRNDAELRRREQAAPGVEHDVVAIYDNAGIPSIMHRFYSNLDYPRSYAIGSVGGRSAYFKKHRNAGH